MQGYLNKLKENRKKRKESTDKTFEDFAAKKTQKSKREKSKKPERKISFKQEEYEYEVKDESFHHFIKQNIHCEKLSTPESFEIVTHSNNEKYTSLLIQNKNKTFELLILENISITSSLIKYKYYKTIAIPIAYLKSDAHRSEPLDKEKLRSITLQENLQSIQNNSVISNAELLVNPLHINLSKLPKMYHASESFLILETREKIILIDFISEKQSILYTKTDSKLFNIIYTWDEKITKRITNTVFNNQINFIKTIRTYVFGLSNNDELHYFIVESNTITKYEIVLSKLGVFGDGVRDIKIITIDQPNYDCWCFMLFVLKESSLDILLSDKLSTSLKVFLTEMSSPKKTKNYEIRNWDLSKLNPADVNSTFSNIQQHAPGEKKFSLFSLTPQKLVQNNISFFNKKLFLNQTDNVSYLSVAFIESLFIVEFQNGPSTIIEDLKRRFHFPSSHDNEEKLYEIQMEILKPSNQQLNHIRRISQNSLEVDCKHHFRKSNSHIFQEIVILDMSFYDIDYMNYSLMIIKEKVCIVSKEKLMLIELFKGKTLFAYNLINDEFTSFLSYPSLIGHPSLLLTKKRLFKFRYIMRFRKLKEVLTQLGSLEIGDTIQNQAAYKIIKHEADHIFKINFDNNKPLNYFSFEDFDELYKLKIEFIWSKVSPVFHQNFCVQCCKVLDPKSESVLKCDKCGMFFYCCKAHREEEWINYHFFECKLVTFLVVMKQTLDEYLEMQESNIKPEQCYTEVLLEELAKMNSDILIEIFKTITFNNPAAYQEAMEFISFTLLFMEKLSLHSFFRNTEKILSILPTNEHDKISLFVSKTCLIEAGYMYVNLSMLMLKFANEAELTRFAHHYIAQLEALAYLMKKDKQLLIKKWKETLVVKTDLAFLQDNFPRVLEKFSFYRGEYGGSLSQIIPHNNDGSEPVIIEFNMFERIVVYSLNHRSALNKYISFLEPDKSADFIISFYDDLSNVFESVYTEHHFQLGYLYFFLTFFLVESKKFSTAIGFLNKSLTLSEENKSLELKFVTLYNIGLLYYAVGLYDEGIHNLEEALRFFNSAQTICTKQAISCTNYLKVLDSLALAYLNKKAIRKSYLLFSESLSIRSFYKNHTWLASHNSDVNRRDTFKIKMYMNYLIDLIEFEMVEERRRVAWNNQDLFVHMNSGANRDYANMKYLKEENRSLVNYVMDSNYGADQLIVKNLYSESFCKVVEFFFNFSSSELARLNGDNQVSKAAEHNGNNPTAHATTVPTPPVPNNTTTLNKNTSNPTLQTEKEKQAKDVNLNLLFTMMGGVKDFNPAENIEIKATFLLTLSKEKQEELKGLDQNLFKRNFILRDPKGVIDHWNINYHPIHTNTFQNVVNNLRNNFIIKEMMKNTLNGTDRHCVGYKYFDYNVNFCIYGLAKYMEKQDIDYLLTMEKYKNKTTDENGKTMLNTQQMNTGTIGNFNVVHREIEFREFSMEIINQIGDDTNSNSFNDILTEIYANCNDDEIKHLMENPELILNFIYSDTNIFGEHDPEERERAIEWHREEHGEENDTSYITGDEGEWSAQRNSHLVPSNPKKHIHDRHRSKTTKLAEGFFKKLSQPMQHKSRFNSLIGDAVGVVAKNDNFEGNEAISDDPLEISDNNFPMTNRSMFTNLNNPQMNVSSFIKKDGEDANFETKKSVLLNDSFNHNQDNKFEEAPINLNNQNNNLSNLEESEIANYQHENKHNSFIIDTHKNTIDPKVDESLNLVNYKNTETENNNFRTNTKQNDDISISHNLDFSPNKEKKSLKNDTQPTYSGSPMNTNYMNAVKTTNASASNNFGESKNIIMSNENMKKSREDLVRERLMKSYNQTGKGGLDKSVNSVKSGNSDFSLNIQKSHTPTRPAKTPMTDLKNSKSPAPTKDINNISLLNLSSIGVKEKSHTIAIKSNKNGSSGKTKEIESPSKKSIKLK